MKTKIIAFTIFGFFLFPNAYAQSSTPSIDKKTFVYKTVGSLPIQADLYRITDGTGLKPVIIWIHGGALMAGGRDNLSEEQKKLYLGAGYSIVSIDYRLAPETKLPAIIEDVQDAVHWVRKNAASLLKVDSTKTFIIGHSAGGYLALMLGSSLKKPAQGIVSFYGYGDIQSDWYRNPDRYYLRTRAHVSEKKAIELIGNSELTSSSWQERGDIYLYSRQTGTWPLMVGGHDPNKDAQWFYQYCPLRNVHANYPPTLLLHGDKDTDVPFEQSVLMDQELTAKKIKHQFIKMNNYEHGFDHAHEDKNVQKVFADVLAFLNSCK